MESILVELVSQRCAEVARELLRLGLKGPIKTIALGLNGSFIFGHFCEEDQQMQWEMKEYGMQPGEFELPINIFLVDSSGTAARVLLETSEDEEVNIQLLDDF